MSNKQNQDLAQIPGYHFVGWIASPHGLAGELYFRLRAQSMDWQTKVVVLLKQGSSKQESFTVEFLKPHKEGYRLKLKGIEDRNQAEEWGRAGLYIPEASLKSSPGEPIFLQQILDFQVHDQNLGEVGVVIGFSSNGAQDLLRVRGANGREILVPLVDAFLTGIDFEGRVINMDLPPGLLQVNES